MTTRRIAAGALAAGVAATLLAAAPASTVSADAATKVKVKNNARGKVLRDRVARIARAQAGDRYVFGATGPGAFDCSGLVVYSYRKATGIVLPRTSYSQQRSITHVRKRDRRIGDIVFLHNGGHVAIYLGKDRIVHASNPSRGVRFDRLDTGYGRSVDGYGRVIQAS